MLRTINRQDCRRKCILCGVIIPTKYRTCNKYMCFYDENTVRTTCWETYHTCSDEELAKRTADRCKKQSETNAACKKYINNK